MTNNQKERDAAIERLSKRWQKKVGLGTRNLAHIYEEGAKGGWNASRKHRDLQIEVLKEALEIYRNRENWLCEACERGHCTDHQPRIWGMRIDVGYEVAEKALEQLTRGTTR